MKSKNQKTDCKTFGKSDKVIVPEKLVNKAGKSVEEPVEERTLTKRNIHTGNGGQTQSWDYTMSHLMNVRKAVVNDRKMQFTALLHHIDVPLLRISFNLLERGSSAGIDTISWYGYGENIDRNLVKLHEKIHNGSYRPKSARRVYIAKMDGSERPISIQCIEDKVVQQAMVLVLEKIYEIDFVGFSYGFRPGRNQHDALDALHVGLMSKKVNWVLDLDIKKFFDQVDHDWLVRFLQHRINDKRIIRIIKQWLKVGYLDGKGRKIKSRVGTPQGSVISPMLSNIYLHYVYDLWCKQWRTRHCTGDMIVIRYADDSVLAFQHYEDAKRFLSKLKERMEMFGLELHENKTKLISFGRFANNRNRGKGLGKVPTFEFLGFKHYCGKTKKSGKFMVWRKTIRKRMNKKLKELRIELMKRRHRPVMETAKWLKTVINGHINYFGVPGNSTSISLFVYELKKAWYRSLCRKSQRKRLNWEKFAKYLSPLLPNPKITHPYPEQRFYAKYSR